MIFTFGDGISKSMHVLVPESCDEQEWSHVGLVLPVQTEVNGTDR
jgi:hypothetical protein